MAEKIQAKCALCGKTLVGREGEEEGQKVTVIKEIIDGFALRVRFRGMCNYVQKVRPRIWEQFLC